MSAGMDTHGAGAAVETIGVCAGYGGADILRGISMSVNVGERVSIIGPNGCGKTTLLKVLCGLVRCSAGEVLAFGENIKEMSRLSIASRMAMMAQITEQSFGFSVLDTVLMGRYSRRKGAFSRSESEDIAAAKRYLSAVGMLSECGRLITELSGGQLQRVMLARAFAQETGLILLDEPTNHLDIKNQVELLEYLHAWVSRGERTAIQVMHDINLAVRYSDRLILMREGELVFDGHPREIVRHDSLCRTFGFDISSFMRESLENWQEEDER